MQHTEEAAEGLSLIKVFLGLANMGAEWVMWLMIGMGFLAAVVGFERLWLFTSTSVDVTRVARNVLKALKAGDLDKARKVVGSGKGMEERVLSDALGAYEEGPDSVEEVATASLIRERQRYDRSVSYLGTVGSNGPFIGLLGTVIGIILSFGELGRNPKGGLEVVGPGISEALVSTAVGLLVAIPAVMVFNNLRSTIKKRVGNTEFLCKLLIGHMKSETRTPLIPSSESDRAEGVALDETPAVSVPKGGAHGRALELG